MPIEEPGLARARSKIVFRKSVNRVRILAKHRAGITEWDPKSQQCYYFITSITFSNIYSVITSFLQHLPKMGLRSLGFGNKIFNSLQLIVCLILQCENTFFYAFRLLNFITGFPVQNLTNIR